MKDERKKLTIDILLEELNNWKPQYPMELIHIGQNQMAMILDYITTLQEENEKLKEKLENKLTAEELVNLLNQELIRQQNDYKTKNQKAIEYGKNCLENIKDQDQYMCESIDIVSLLQMIHQNYLDILQGDDKE